MAQRRIHYNYFRDYEPAIGRYVQSDPIGLKGGLGTFGYARNSPLGDTDLWGLAPGGGRWRPLTQNSTPCCREQSSCKVVCNGMPVDVRVFCTRWIASCGSTKYEQVLMPFLWPWMFRGWSFFGVYTCEEFDRLVNRPLPPMDFAIPSPEGA